jgi:ADP-ribosyl-[dinitrogen reductase] hydrolase
MVTPHIVWPTVRRRGHITPADRLMGGMIGLLLGDALGVPVEFSSRADRDRDPVRGLRSYGTHSQPVGSWSDDGAMALAHAHTFIQHGWDPERHLQAFQAWHKQACYTSHGLVFDIGLATTRSLNRYRKGHCLTQVGGRRVHDNGNGSLMRILPAACWWAGADAATIIARLCEVSALTHAHARAQLFCALHALMVDGLLARRSIIACLLGAAETLLPFIPAEERYFFAQLFDASWLEQPRAAIPSDGHVVSTLIAACWCLHRHDDFASAVLEAVNLGGDTDTVGAVTGGLAGLRCGFSGLPRAWIMTLPKRIEVVGDDWPPLRSDIKTLTTKQVPLLELVEDFAQAGREQGWA